MSSFLKSYLKIHDIYLEGCFMASPINLRAVQLSGGGFKRMWAPNLNRKFPLVSPDLPEIVPTGPFRVISATKRSGAALRPGGECVAQIGGMEVWKTLLMREIAYIDPLVIDPTKMERFATSALNRNLLRSNGLRVRGDDYTASEVTEAICGRMMDPTDENYIRVLTPEEIIAQHDGPSHEELVSQLPSRLGKTVPLSAYPMLAGFLGFAYEQYASNEDFIDGDTIRGYVAGYSAQCDKFLLNRVSQDLAYFFIDAFLRGSDEAGYELVPPEIANHVCGMISDLFKG